MQIASFMHHICLITNVFVFIWRTPFDKIYIFFWLTFLFFFLTFVNYFVYACFRENTISFSPFSFKIKASWWQHSCLIFISWITLFFLFIRFWVDGLTITVECYAKLLYSTFSSLKWNSKPMSQIPRCWTIQYLKV